MSLKLFLITYCIGFIFGFSLLCGTPERPNFIIIMTDDSGYSDLGCYGGEIETPNLDRMAANGLRFRNFYNNGRCSPTRASLMTGRDAAHAGFAAGTLGGWRLEVNQAAYRGRLPYDLPTIAEVMKASGYQTMMTGKWHLGGSLMKQERAKQNLWKKLHPSWELTQAEIEGDFNALPAQRGFDQFFGLIEGETHQFFIPSDRHQYLEGNQPATLKYQQVYDMHCYSGMNRHSSGNHGRTAKAFYGTDGMTDRAIEMIEHAVAQPDPFFLYMAYRAPHLPLQAPQELVDKYLPYYADLGEVEAARLHGLTHQGLWEEGTAYRESFTVAKPLTEENQRDYQLRAAVHAAMMEKVDDNIGKVLQTLNRVNVLNNTVIIYLSDNGAASHLGALMNVPYYGTKAQLWEGGTKTHCIVHWPDLIQAGAITDSIGWVGDLLPTCLDIAGGTYPTEFRGSKTAPLDGRSLLPIFKGEQMVAPNYLFSNDQGQQAVIYQGRWKLLIEPGWYVHSSKRPGTAYELYDLGTDPAEKKNLAKQYPEMVMRLARVCEEWQAQNGIVDYAEILKIRSRPAK
ncbi:sulfatase-like hydrolase/transferase [Coraliomargarita sp. W4R72]